jgi:hypothetical protein
MMLRLTPVLALALLLPWAVPASAQLQIEAGGGGGSSTISGITGTPGDHDATCWTGADALEACGDDATNSVFAAGITATLLTVTGNVTAEDILLEDSDASHYLTLTTTSDLTAGRILTLVPGDAARTITLSGNPTLADWFDQDVQAAASPTFAAVLTGLLDPAGAVDLDLGSADITDVTLITDGGTWIIDNSLVFPDEDADPAVAGALKYDNAVTGLVDGAMVFYDDDEIRRLVDVESEEGDYASGDDGHVVTFNWNSGAGYYDLQAGPAASFDSTAVDATTWSDSANATNVWTFDVSGTDWTQTFGSASTIFGGGLDTVEVRGLAGAYGTQKLTTAELTVVDWNYLGCLEFQAPLEASGGDGALSVAAICSRATETFSASANGANLNFYTADGAAYVKRLSIDKAGNMSLGGDTPAAFTSSKSPVLEIEAVSGSDTALVLCSAGCTVGWEIAMSNGGSDSVHLQFFDDNDFLHFDMDYDAADSTHQAKVLDAPDFVLSNGATARYRRLTMTGNTVTLAGTTQVTTLNQGMGLDLPAITFNQSGGAVTVDQASTLHVPVITAGSSVTITANRMISTGVADAYLTVGGVWTDTASTRKVKKNIRDMDMQIFEGLFADLRPRSWNYNEHFNNDFGRTRYGLVAEEFPEWLKIPGEENPSGVSGVVMANFALAAAVYHEDRIDALQVQVDTLLALLADLENKL